MIEYYVVKLVIFGHVRFLGPMSWVRELDRALRIDTQAAAEIGARCGMHAGAEMAEVLEFREWCEERGGIGSSCKPVVSISR